MAEELTLEQVDALIREQYPTLLAILDKPGVRDAVTEAINGHWDPGGDRFKVRMQQTDWYKTTTANERDWESLKVIDPATAQQRTGEATEQANTLASRLGITIPADTMAKIVDLAAANQWSNSELQYHIAFEARGGNVDQGGELANTADQFRKIAGDYGVPISDQTLNQWAAKAGMGTADTQGFTDYAIEQAKSLYPSLSAALDQGLTVRQYADPYAQIAARELNINPDNFNLSDQKWSAPLQQIDPKTGQRAAMSLDQWQTTVRTDPKYGYDMTQGARSQAASLTTALAQKLGVVA